MAARREKLVHESSSHCLSSWKTLVMILMLAIGIVLYTKFLLQDVMQRATFPGYLSSNSLTIDNLYYSFSEDANSKGGLTALAPTASLIPGTNISNIATQPGDPPDNMNAENPQDIQYENVTNSSSNLAPAATPAPDGANLNSTITEPTDSPGAGMNIQTQEAQTGSLANSTTSSQAAKFSVLLGVFIMSYEMKRRDLIRLAYREQSSEYADFTVRFILGGYKLESWLEPENATNGDMIVLQCKENMNEGKTFTFFSTLPDLGYHYDYVMKLDDDSYVNFANLGKHLAPFPRTDLYYGYSLPCDKDDPRTVAHFRVGAGYVLSWDLIMWIKDSPISRNHTIGTEDSLVGNWFKEGEVAKNRPYSEHLFHDHPDQGGPCSKQVTKESILVHTLKSEERWYEVINFFNVSTIN